MVDIAWRERLRTEVATHRADARRLREEILDVGMKDRFIPALHFLDDVDQMLSDVKETRTPEQESRWLEFAESHLSIALKALHDINALVQKYGGPEHVRAIGS